MPQVLDQKNGDKIKISPPFPFLGYILAVVISFANIYLKEFLHLDVGTPYLTALFAVFISSFFGGVGSGMLATLLTAFLINYFFIPPYHSFILTHERFIHVLAYITEGVIVSIFMEILKKDKEALLLKSSWFETTLGSIGDGVITTDSKGRVTFMNPVAEGLTGFKLSEVVGRPIYQIFRIQNEKTKLKAANPVDKVLKCEAFEGLANHTVLVDKKGKEKPIENSAAPILGSAGKLIGVVLVFRDISHRRSLEQQKDDFISITSHELKTPLTSIKAYAQILSRQLLKKKEGDSSVMISHMNLQIDKMIDMVNKLLDVSRIEAGNLKLEMSKFKIDDLIEEVINDVTRTDSGKHKILHYCGIKQLVTADRNRLEQVITKLLTNAIKYSPKSSTININVEKEKKNMILSVRDHGIGIPADKKKFIFNRFYRVNPAKGGNGNTSSLGLGLYISQNIMSEHHGRIWVDTKERQGSTFYISLPMK